MVKATGSRPRVEAHSAPSIDERHWFVSASVRGRGLIWVGLSFPISARDSPPAARGDPLAIGDLLTESWLARRKPAR